MSEELVDLVVKVPRTALTLVAPPPALVTQVNCEPHLGYTKRLFLERVRDYAADGGGVVVDGKIRGVRPDDFLRWLERRSAMAAKTRPIPANDRDEVDRLADKIADELGLRCTGGAK